MRTFDPNTLSLLDFIREHEHQIKTKGNRHHLEIDEIKSELAIIFLTKISAFDEKKGSLSAFLFGHLEKKLRRKFSDALTYSDSLDVNSNRGLSLRAHIESITLDHFPDDHPVLVDISANAEALSFASAISGKSSLEISKILGVSRRRINQILVRIGNEQRLPKKQLFLFPLPGDCA